MWLRKEAHEKSTKIKAAALQGGVSKKSSTGMLPVRRAASKYTVTSDTLYSLLLFDSINC